MKIYVVPAAGGEAEQVVPGEDAWRLTLTGFRMESICCLTRSRLLVRDMSDLAVKIVNLATHKVSTMEGSHGIRSPRCSPDGKLILRCAGPGQELVLCRMGVSEYRFFRERTPPYHVAYPFCVRWKTSSSGLSLSTPL